MIYLFCFFVSTIFAVLAERSHNKAGFIFWSIISVMITTLLAGLRYISVGIDTANYYRSWHIASTSSNLWEYMRWYFLNEKGEFLFALFYGGVAQVFKNYNYFLFFSSLITVGAVYIGAFRLHNYIYPPLVLLLFYLIYYNYTFNIMRQMMVIAIQFAFLSDLLNKKYIKFLIVIIITVEIHTTAWMALIILFSFMYLYGDKKKETLITNNLRSRAFTLIVGILTLVIVFESLTIFLINNNYIPRRFLWYFNEKETINPKLANSLFALELVFLMINLPIINKKYKTSTFFIVSTISFIILYQLARSVNFGKRLSQYYCLINIATICMIANIQNNKNLNKIIISTGIIFTMTFYWFYFYYLKNASHTVPYISIFSK